MDKKNFYKKKLKNGMTILFEKRKNSGVISLVFAVRSGSIDEEISKKGISHFIEHMLYKGTKKRKAEEISKEIEKKGGILNGFTSEQIVAYFCKMPNEHIDIALDVISDMVKNPLFDKEEFDKEKKVILEEKKMVYDEPRMYCMDKIMSCLYKGTLAEQNIGTDESLKNMKREDLIKRFKELYVASNIILCVVGDTDFDKLCDFCEKNFENKKLEMRKQKITLNNDVKIERRKELAQASLVFAFHVPLALKEGSYDAQVLNALMTGGMSSRLWLEIREKRNLAYAVKGGCNSDKEYGYNYVYIGTSKDNIEKVKKLIIEEFKKVSEDLNEKELNEVKEQMIGINRIDKEESQSRMIELLSFELWGDAEKAFDYEANIKKVKLENVKKMAANVLKNNSFFILEPE